MRFASALLVLGLAGAIAPVAVAAGDPTVAVEPGETPPPVAVPDEPVKPISPDEIQDPGGRSGFWTSRAPAKYGAYRWRLLGIGVFLAGVTGLIMMRLVKRTKSDNSKKRGPRWPNEPRLPDDKRAPDDKHDQ